MITQQQAKTAVELLKEAPKILATAMMKTETETEKVYGEWALKRKKLLQEIEANEPMTNGDKWRSMTDEQIAEIIQSDGCCACPVDERICTEKTQVKVVINEDEFNNLCKAAIVKWLKQEAKQ